MHLGVLSSIFNADSLETSFAMAADASAEGIEIFCRGTEGRGLLAPDQLKHITGLAQKHTLAVPSFLLAFLCEEPALIGRNDTIQRNQELIIQAIKAAGEAAVPVIGIPFFGKNIIETEKELAAASDALLELVEPAEEAGVIIAIESTLNFTQQKTLYDYLGRSPAMKLYYDTGNAEGRKIDLPTGIRELGPDAIGQIHFKDVCMGVTGEPPNYKIALGEGDVDFDAVIEALKAVGYDGWVILETSPLDDPPASAKANLAFAREKLGL